MKKLTYDVLIKNTKIIDGARRKYFEADIGIKGEKIVKIGKIDSGANTILDAKGLVATPGLIDIHSHGDETLLQYPRENSAIMQGITTIVGGNCGFSPAPLKGTWLLSFWEYDWWHELTPYIYSAPTIQPLDKVREKMKEIYNIDIDWHTLKEFLNKLEKEGISINYVPLVGHNTIRAQVMEEDYKRKAIKDEIEEMKVMVKRSMEDGAFGLSTGLDYPPGYYAEKEELVEIVKCIREYGGIYATHWRRTGLREAGRIKPIEKIRGIEEAIEIGKETGVGVEISHLISGYTVYPEPCSSRILIATANETLNVIEKGIDKGVDVTFDVIPNIDGGVLIIPNLISIFAPLIIEAGSCEKFVENLKVKDFRERIKKEIKNGKWWSINPNIDPYWARKVKILLCKNKVYNGMTIGKISEKEGKDPIDVIFDIIIEDADTKIEQALVIEEEVKTFLKHPKAMVGSDTFVFDKKWSITGYPPYFLPHPNTYGAFPRFLRKYVKEDRVLSLEEAISKITYMPAKRMNIKKRGLIKKGYFADILIFDYKKIGEKGEYIEPRRYPKGIEYVIVNGEITVMEGQYTGKKAGKILRKNRRCNNDRV